MDAMDADTAIKLSFLVRRKRLPVLPDQPEDDVYGIVWGAWPIPRGGLCYVVRFEGRSRAAVLGYVSDDGRVYRAVAPREGDPELDDLALVLVRDRDRDVGGVYIAAQGGALRRATGFCGSIAGTMHEVADTATWHTEHSMAYREFMATMFLRLCVFDDKAAGDGDPDGADARVAGIGPLEHLDRPVELFADFMHTLLPDAIATLLYRIDAQERPSGIERYARRLLTEIDLPRLRHLSVTVGVNLARIQKMNGFYINFDRDAAQVEDIAFLFGVEARLNRLSAILDRLGVGLSPLDASPTEEACGELDIRCLESVTAHVARIAKQAERAPRSSWSTPGTVACEPGGEWDVRMHMAELCEELNLIVRLEYRFDFRAADGLLAIQFTGATADEMPYTVYYRGQGVWLALDADVRERMAREYSARIALVLAAAAFAASPVVSQCLVEERGVAGEAVRGYRLERAAFAAVWVARARKLEGASLADGGVDELLREQETDERFARIVAPEALCAPRDDDRPLPPQLRDLLRADTARELEVVEDPDDAYHERFAELQTSMLQDPQNAEARLSDLIDEMQVACVAQELTASGPVTTQFCENHLGRIVLPLLVPDTETRVLRAPDTLFFAQFELCTLYLRSGRYERALALARQLLDMAATSMQAHFMLVNVLARLRMFDEVIEVAKHGLRVSCDREATAYLFYRLAFAYWNEGDRLTALACYRLVPPGEQISAVAQEEAQELMRRLNMSEPLSLEQATALANAAGVPVPPTAELFHQVVDAAVLLLDNGFQYLAARCVYAMWRMYGKDELGVLSKSLLFE